MKEVFKDVKGYEGKYKISNMGNVISLIDNNVNIRKVPKKRKLTKDQKGYYRIRLFKNCIGKTCKVHRLVAQTFITNPNEYPQVNHKDGDKQNNNVNNLEWCTNSINSAHAVKMGLKKGHVAWNKGLKGVCVAWNKGKKLSKEHIKNLSESHKGQIPWNKGLKKEL